MKHFILSFLTLFMALSASAQANGAITQQFFQLPIIPDSIQNFQRRCDFMVKHYWDYCDLKKAFSSPDKMADAFATYLDFMPYATADVVFASVDKFMKDVSKKPENAAFIGRLAEEKLFSDSAEFRSEQLYTHFLDNLLKVKKLDKEAKERYQRQANILHNSQEGMVAPAFDFTRPDGTSAHFAPDPSQFATVLMFVVPGNTESDLARLRLDADIKTTQLIEAGLVTIVCIAVEEGNGQLPCPKGWEVGFAPTITDTYDVRYLPMFYILNSDGKILKKDPDIVPLLSVMQQLRLPKKKSENNQVSDTTATAE